MPIFRQFRRSVEAVEALTAALVELGRLQRELGPATDRLAKLELSRHQFEAEMDGKLLKADGKLKAASNAEARERQLKKSYEKHLDPFPPDGAEIDEEGKVLLPVDAQRSEAEGMRPLHLDVAPNDKAHAMRMKWSGR